MGSGLWIITSTLPLTISEHVALTATVVLAAVSPFTPVAYLPSWAEVDFSATPTTVVTATIWGTPTAPGIYCFDFVAWPVGGWVQTCLEALNVNEPPTIVGVGQEPRPCLLGQRCVLWARWEDPDVREAGQSPPSLSASFSWLEGPFCVGDVCRWQGRYGLEVEHDGMVTIRDEEYEASLPFSFRRPHLRFLPIVLKGVDYADLRRGDSGGMAVGNSCPRKGVAHWDGFRHSPDARRKVCPVVRYRR